MSGAKTEKLRLPLPGNPQLVPKLPAPRLFFLVRKQQSRITQFQVTMGSTPPPPLILRRPLPAAMPMQNVPPRRLLRRSPDGHLPPLLAPRVTENGRKQPPHAWIPVAPARFRRRAPSAIARAPRHGGPAEIATQAAGSAPTRLPPTTQSSARPIATISHVPLRGDFVSAWAYRRAR
jgi:hypothetical protein